MKRILFLVAALLLAVFLQQSFAQGWQQQSNGLPVLWSISAVDTNTCWVAGDRMLVMRTTNGGTNWIANSDNGLVAANYGALYARSANLAWVANTNQIYKTTNGGTNWSKIYEYTGPGAQYCFFDDIFFWDDLTGIIVSDQVLANPNTMMVLRTTDGGSTWNTITSGLPSGNALYGLAGSSLDVVGNHCWYTVLSGTATDTTAQRFLLHSRDKGLTWESLPIPANSGLYAASFSDTLRGVIAGGGKHIAQTTDGGKTWKTRYDGIAGWPMRFAKGTAVVLANGPFDNTSGSLIAKSSDYGATWTTQPKQSRPGITSLSVLDQNYAWACGGDNTILRTRSGGIQTNIANENPTLPSTFQLLQNYPNPFNPSTVIKFRLEEAGSMQLCVYDELGREVRVLMDGYQSAGWKQIVWDGRDNANRPVASGVYFYALRGENRMDAKKMILLK
ncbi:MAG: FlgD immunoglobulin-like domain containing protein [Bacteroidota bacterium]|jgi:photosystem II stability/assembly factor-like uncharacterized protein